MSATISRRNFFRWLPLSTAGLAHIALAGAPTTLRAKRTYRLETFYIAGYRFHEGLGLEHELGFGTPLNVVFEPENPHDVKAIRLEYQGANIGYIPMRLNHTLANLLSQGAPLVAQVIMVNREEPPWHRVKVEIAIPTTVEQTA